MMAQRHLAGLVWLPFLLFFFPAFIINLITPGFIYYPVNHLRPVNVMPLSEASDAFRIPDVKRPPSLFLRIFGVLMLLIFVGGVVGLIVGNRVITAPNWWQKASDISYVSGAIMCVVMFYGHDFVGPIRRQWVVYALVAIFLILAGTAIGLLFASFFFFNAVPKAWNYFTNAPAVTRRYLIADIGRLRVGTKGCDQQFYMYWDEKQDHIFSLCELDRMFGTTVIVGDYIEIRGAMSWFGQTVDDIQLRSK